MEPTVLDGAWYGQGGELRWEGLGHMKTTEVGAVLERTVKRIGRHLQRRGLLRIDEDDVDPDVLSGPAGHHCQGREIASAQYETDRGLAMTAPGFSPPSRSAKPALGARSPWNDAR